MTNSDVIPFRLQLAIIFSTMRTSLAGAAVAAVAVCLTSTASAWVVSNVQYHQMRSFPIAFATAAADEANTNGNSSSSSTDDDARQPQSQADIVIMDNVEPQAVYGVSYIGGDPCGSKYNDDPFDAAAQITKPGMPDDAKERIRLLAEKMKRKQEEEKAK